MLKRFLLMWVVNVAALFVASALLDVDYSTFWKLILAGLVFGLVNSLVRPVVRLFLETAGLPLVILTFGVALLLVNVLMLYLTSWIVTGFDIGSFGSAVGAAIVIWFVQLVLEAVFGLNKRKKDKR